MQLNGFKVGRRIQSKLKIDGNTMGAGAKNTVFEIVDNVAKNRDVKHTYLA